MQDGHHDGSKFSQNIGGCLEPAIGEHGLTQSAYSSWLSRIGRLFGNDKPVAPRRLSRADVDNLRYPPLQESDLHGIHFAAVE